MKPIGLGRRPQPAPDVRVEADCDRCGRVTPGDWLTWDGLGMCCPGCRAGDTGARLP